MNTIKDHDSLNRFIAEGSRRDSARRCSFPVEFARRMGVTDEQIISYRARITGFDVAAARDAGFTNDEIIDYLARGDEMPGDDSELAGKAEASAETSDELVTAGGQEAVSVEEPNQRLTETAGHADHPRTQLTSGFDGRV